MVFIRDKKGKGTAGERELVHMFWQRGWPCIRVAGSGSGRYPSPDLLAGNRERKVALECKTIGNRNIYISKEQINGLKEFCAGFGAEAYVGVKFPKDGWLFLSLDDLNECKSSYTVSSEIAKAKGFIIDELIGNKL